MTGRFPYLDAFSELEQSFAQKVLEDNCGEGDGFEAWFATELFED
jgi:hypothetical protein